MVTSDFTLDITEINKIIQDESRKPAQCVKSEYDYPDWGTVWLQEWELLDPSTGDSLGLEYPLRSTHNMPDPEKKHINRGSRTYVRSVKGFNDCGIQGTLPEHFLGARCWIEEIRERDWKDRNTGDTRQGKVWWRPFQSFTPGEPLSSEDDGVPGSDYLNPPVAEVVEVGDPYQFMANLIDGKTHRQAIDLIRKSPLVDNEEFMAEVNSGNAFEEVKKRELMEEINNRYTLIE